MGQPNVTHDVLLHEPETASVKMDEQDALRLALAETLVKLAHSDLRQAEMALQVTAADVARKYAAHGAVQQLDVQNRRVIVIAPGTPS